MEGLIATFIVIANVVLFALLAQAYDVDSRSSYQDDWSR